MKLANPVRLGQAHTVRVSGGDEPVSPNLLLFNTQYQHVVVVKGISRAPLNRCDCVFFYLILADLEEFKDANAGGWRAMGSGALHCYHNS